MSRGRTRFAVVSLAALLSAAPVAAAAATPATAAAGHSQRSPRRPHRGRHAARVAPRAFASCARLVSYARHYYATTHGIADPPVAPVAEAQTLGAPSGTSGVVAPSAPTPAAATNTTSTGGSSFSTTNDQEQGVDEPDIVKTDGSTIFAVSGNTLYAVATAGGTPRLVGSLDLGTNAYGSQLLLDGTRLLVISGGGAFLPPVFAGGPERPALAIAPSPYDYYGAKTVVREVDVHDPAAMRVTQTLSVDGSFVDARQNGDTARLVISSAPRAGEYPASAAGAGGWVPVRRLQVRAGAATVARPVAPCRSIVRPVSFSGLGMLTIVTIDIPHGLASTTSTVLMGDPQIVYGSTQNLYVVTQHWLDPELPVADLPTSQSSVIYQFDVGNPDATTFSAAGEVPGYVLNQFSLSEFDGFLRVATTSRPIWWGGQPQQLSQSYVTVLADHAGALLPVGQLSGLGAGQQIYSVRFVGDTGYVVTFRQVDPLYTIDLTVPSAPRVAGQLELEGYSAYLQPLGVGLLLGIGQSVSASTNEPSGVQLELFDVADPSHPSLLAQTALGSGSSSEVQYDHHALLYWPPTGLAVLPVEIYPQTSCGAPTPVGAPVAAATPAAVAAPIEPCSPPGTSGTGSSSSSFVGALGFHVDRASGITQVGSVTQPATNGYTPTIERSLVIGDQLFTLSDAGVQASRLSDLTPQTFVAFPTPQPVAEPGGTGVASTGPGVPTG